MNTNKKWGESNPSCSHSIYILCIYIYIASYIPFWYKNGENMSLDLFSNTSLNKTMYIICICIIVYIHSWSILELSRLGSGPVVVYDITLIGIFNQGRISFPFFQNQIQNAFKLSEAFKLFPWKINLVLIPLWSLPALPREGEEGSSPSIIW